MKELIKSTVAIAIAVAAIIVLLRLGSEIGAQKVLQISAPRSSH